MATTIVAAGSGYLYWVIAARGYPATTIGLAAALIAGQALTAMLCCLGIDALVIQVLPRLGDDRAWSTLVTASILVTGCVSATVASGVALALVHFSSHYAVLRRPEYFVVFVLGSAVGTAGGITDAVFISTRRSGRTLMRNLTFGLLKLPIMAIPLLVHDHPGALTILLSWLIANAVSVSLAHGYHMRKVRPGYRPALRGGLAALFHARTNIAAHFFTNVGSQTPQFLLPMIVIALLSPQADAYFYLTWSVGGVFLVISPAISSSLFAEGSNAEDLADSGRRSIRYVTALLIPFVLMVVVLDHRILSIFGPTYAARGGTLLLVLACSAVPDAINNIYVSVERVKGHFGRVAVLNMSTAAITIGLTLLIIHRQGVSGPGDAWLMSQTAGAVLIACSLARSLTRDRDQVRASGYRSSPPSMDLQPVVDHAVPFPLSLNEESQ